MGYLIEISESKVGKMSEYAEDALHAMGRLMSCISSLENGGYGERGMNYRDDSNYSRSMMGNRYYGERGMNYRDEDEYDEEMSERRGRRRRDSQGRYR